MSSIGVGDGVVAIVQPIQAPMARTAKNAIKTGIAMTQNLMVSKAGQKKSECVCNCYGDASEED